MAAGLSQPHQSGLLLRRLGLLYLAVTPLDLLSLPGGTPTRYAGLLFLGIWLLQLLIGRVRLPQHSFAMAMAIAFSVWGFLSIGWSFSPSATSRAALTTLILVMSALAVGSAFPNDVIRPAWAFLLGSSVAAALTLTNGSEIINELTYSIDTMQYTAQPGVDQNALAFHLLLGCAAGLYILGFAAVGWQKWMVQALVLLQILAVVLVGSRTGVGTLMALLVIYAAVTIKQRRSLLSTAVAVAASSVLIALLAAADAIPPRVREWLSSPSANDERNQIIDAYLESFPNWWLRGVGAGADSEYLAWAAGMYRNAHSTFWKIWIEMGLIGLSIYFLLVASLAFIAWRSDHRQFFVLAALPIVTFAYTLGPVNSNVLWAIFGLALGVSGTVRGKTSIDSTQLKISNAGVVD